jgi:hypothetical protein
MHAIGRQAKQNLKKRDIFLPDFQAVFHGIDRRLLSFMEVESVTKNEAGQTIPPARNGGCGSAR